MKLIDDLIIYFGYYKSNAEFQKFLERVLLAPTTYNSHTLYIVCKKSKLEIGFTNERMIRESDKDKPIVGGRPIFTHFNIYPTQLQIFDDLPFDILFSDNLEIVRQKAGIPTRSIDKKIPILGWNKMDTYDLDKVSISFSYNPSNNSIQFIQVAQKEKEIIEASKDEILE